MLVAQRDEPIPAFPRRFRRVLFDAFGHHHRWHIQSQQLPVRCPGEAFVETLAGYALRPVAAQQKAFGVTPSDVVGCSSKSVMHSSLHNILESVHQRCYISIAIAVIKIIRARAIRHCQQAADTARRDLTQAGSYALKGFSRSMFL